MKFDEIQSIIELQFLIRLLSEDIINNKKFSQNEKTERRKEILSALAKVLKIMK